MAWILMIPSTYIFLHKTGNNLKQITPKGLNVVSWTLSKGQKNDPGKSSE